MLSEQLLLSALKTRFDGDTILSGLLKKKTGSTKVMLGPARPSVGSNPTLQVHVTEHRVDEEAKWDIVEVAIEIHSSDREDGTADVLEIGGIADRVATLVEDLPPALTGHNSFNIGLFGMAPVVPGNLGPDGKPEHFQQMRFITRGIKLT